jgi:pimeloyl-ACP methyl ester carboxylesterase
MKRSLSPELRAVAARIVGGPAAIGPAARQLVARGRTVTFLVVTGLAVTVLAAAGCSSTPGGSSGSPASANLSWHPCPGAAGGVSTAGRLQCASLQVPVNYSNPSGRKITLALSEVPATAPAGQQQGALLVNPGGPGASGLSMAASVAAGLAPSVAAKYDIVGFDTRGVGASVPALHCDPSFFSTARPNFVPSSQAAERVLVDRAKQYAADCQRRFGWLLPHMTSQDLARDMDSIRAALGQKQISYYGVSYGTYLGQVYATLFPHRVRRMALDSIVNPGGVWYADNIGQDYAFQGRMQAFFQWIAANHSSFQLGATEPQVYATYNAAMAKLASRPISANGRPLIGPDELSDTLLVGGYTNSWWPYLAAALAGYVHGGQTTSLISLFRQIGQQNENEFAVYSAVDCSDVAWPRSWAFWNSDTRKVSVKAPYETWANAWFNAACAFWPVRGPAKPQKIGAAGLPPILLLQGTLDAATPYPGAIVVRRLLPTSRLVVTKGSGNHGQSLAVPPNQCVDGYLNRYLADSSLPAQPGLVNATCQALPPPKA